MQKTQNFQLSKDQVEELRAALKTYFLDELEMEIGSLQAVLFIDFLSNKFGPKYYNLGVKESIKCIKEKTEDLVLLLREE